MIRETTAEKYIDLALNLILNTHDIDVYWSQGGKSLPNYVSAGSFLWRRVSKRERRKTSRRNKDMANGDRECFFRHRCACHIVDKDCIDE